MKPMTLEDFYNDPDLPRRAYQAAQRERARALSAGFAWLRDFVTSRMQSRPTRWIARLG